MPNKRPAVPAGRIEDRILMIRGQKVMLSTDLAELYEVEPRALVQAAKRNMDRFPEDFMFQLSQEEFADLKSQIVTSSWGDLRWAAPYAFTEQGVAMLSSVLHSKRAVLVNIQIMRPSCTCQACLLPMLIWPASSMLSKRSTMPSSRWSSMPSVN